MYFAMVRNYLCDKCTNYLSHICGDCFVFSPHREKETFDAVSISFKGFVVLPLAVIVWWLDAGRILSIPITIGINRSTLLAMMLNCLIVTGYNFDL